MPRTYHTRHAPARTARLTAVAFLLAQWLPSGLLHAEPSQAPLLNRPNLTPPANVMFTLDDSGSMTYQYLPERSFELNGQTVDFPNDGKIFMHPRELPVNRFTFKDRSENSNYADTRFITAAPESELTNAMILLQAQMRSPQVNRLYYNPELRYTPWKTANGQEYRPADKAKAWLLPSYLHPARAEDSVSTEYVNLTDEGGQHSVRWYCREKGDWSKCEDNGYALTSLHYSPALLYMLRAGGNPNNASHYTLYNLNTISSVEWPASFTARTDCTLNTSQKRVCTKEQEQQNFANWFVYYRSRLFVAQGKIPEAIAGSLGDIRLGWGTIHPKHLDTGDQEWTSFTPDQDKGSTANQSATVQQGVRLLNETHLAKFTEWLRGLETVRRTPTLHAMYSVGQYFQRTDALSPWQNDLSPGGSAGSASAPLACRRAFHLMVTDGYYQTDGELNGMFRQAGLELTEVGNADADASATGTTPTAPIQPFPGTRNTAGALLTRKVFADEVSNSLADYAMRLWLTDLQPSIANNLKPIDLRSDATSTAPEELLKEAQSNPATWQHLTHFMVGFGVTGSLTKDDSTLKSMLTPNTTTAWPSSLNRVDDLWHAAVNSRGEYFSANNPEELQKSLLDALGAAGSMVQKEAGLATASVVLEAGNVKYVPEYDSKGWTGDIKAFSLKENGDVDGGRLWSAWEQMPKPENRNIAIWQSIGDELSKGSAVAFQHDNLNAATKAILSETLVEYTRGLASESFRARESAKVGITNKIKLLPDFVNSTPLMVSKGFDLGYGSTQIAGSSTYSGANSFLSRKNQRSDGLLFAGSNGGMLHAFSTTSGTEVFAFIPQTAVPKLPLVAAKRYGRPDTPHQYGVDGQLIESDIYVSENGGPSAWQNIVVGTMGAGGKSVFALKIPDTDVTQIDANSVKWETTHPDMGYMTSAPQVGYTPSGWKVFIGNGVDSSNGRTALLVIDAQSGAVQSIPVDMGSTTDKEHGLGGVTLVRNGSGIVTAVYAGDTRGRFWRFDVKAKEKEGDEEVSVGYQKAPIFTALNGSNPQPILAAPYVTAHPRGGRVLVVNTGKLLYNADATDTRVQSVYGVWEKASASTPSGELTSPGITRDNLVTQTVGSLVEIKQNGTEKTKGFFDISSNVVDWSSKLGWVLDLAFPDSTQTNSTYSYPKALYEPVPIFDSVVISAVKPASIVPSCDQGQDTGYSVVLDALTGVKSPLMLDTNGDGGIGDGDGGESAYLYGGGSQRVLVKPQKVYGDGEDPSDDDECKSAASIQNSEDAMLVGRCPPKKNRQIKDRVWRQLLNPPTP